MEVYESSIFIGGVSLGLLVVHFSEILARVVFSILKNFYSIFGRIHSKKIHLVKKWI